MEIAIGLFLFMSFILTELSITWLNKNGAGAIVRLTASFVAFSLMTMGVKIIFAAYS